MKNINEVIIVEGKNDTKKLKKIFPNIETFETNGFDLTKEKISLIKEIHSKRGIICLFDPDYAGKKIRNVLINEISDAKHAFISIDDIKNNKKKGVAEASDDSIQKALINLFSFNQNQVIFSWDEYLLLDLNSKEKRLNICNKLNIPYYNHKQLFKILKMIGINYIDLKKVINE